MILYSMFYKLLFIVNYSFNTYLVPKCIVRPKVTSQISAPRSRNFRHFSFWVLAEATTQLNFNSTQSNSYFYFSIRILSEFSFKGSL